MGKTVIPQDIRQNEINYICTVLNHQSIRTTQDLTINFDQIIEQIYKNPQVFKKNYTTEECFEILKKAIAAYNNVYAYKINLKEEHKVALTTALEKKDKVESTTLPEDDLSKVTKGYDRLEIALEKEKQINKSILRVLKDKDFAVVPQIIIGSGDTGTTLWLEKFKKHHGATQEQLEINQLPSVLMIGSDAGSWKHDYTLAQPHSILERTAAKENPSIYLSTEYYRKNPHANGRHVYQANQVNLGFTEAPLLRASVVRIEKRSNHLGDWKDLKQEYRLIVKTPEGIKSIYTNELNICTGLGPARNIISGSLISRHQFESLSRVDPIKGFPPIIDGNQFILTDTEELNKEPRKVVIYGGGGTAAACYRKSFFGHDVRTETMEFDKENQKNSVVWIARQFEKAGTGKLATTALTTAKTRNELIQAELIKIEPQISGKLLLSFKTEDSGKTTKKFDIECDQLIYSVGQDDSLMRSICKEVEGDLSLVYDKNDMLLNVCSSDKKVIFFGAAAMAVREKEYMDATWKWLRSENIGGDVGPGSMPPSRAQIKCYNFWSGQNPTSINANIDNQYLIIKYLENARVEKSIAEQFVKDLLQARKSSTSGASYSLILDLLKKHKLDQIMEIKGHGHLALKTTSEPAPPLSKPKQPLLSWLGPQRKTDDANVFVSSAVEDIRLINTMENQEHGVQLYA